MLLVFQYQGLESLGPHIQLKLKRSKKCAGGLGHWTKFGKEGRGGGGGGVSNIEDLHTKWGVRNLFQISSCSNNEVHIYCPK